ncbi:MAG: phosphate ABC transporter permease PstA [Clostridiales bacterium]|nr:phosphate ABC transporter permease PstA [Clostridiales bacterium]
MAKKRTAAGRKANPFGRYFNRACQKTRFSASPLYGQNPPKEENYVNNKPAKHSNAAAIAAVGKYVSYAAAAAAVFALLAVVLFVLINGLPHVTGELLFGAFNYGGAPSIAASLLATAMLIFLTSLIAFPIGVFTAIFLAEYTVKGGKFVRLIRLTVETLGGIPSIVYGLFGMIFFCGILNMGTSIIAGCLTVSLMIIPTTVRGTEEALLAVPDSLREGSYALGGGRLTTVRRVVLPPALPGILAAVILGIGRMAAESAPVLFTMGASLKPTPTGYRSSGTTLAVALYALAREGAYVDEAYATACVLVVGVLTLNIISAALGARLQKKLSGGGGIKAQSK